MPIIQYHLKLDYIYISINSSTSLNNHYSLQAFYGSSRHQTQSFQCIQKKNFTLHTIHLASLIKAQLQIWLMNQGTVIAHGKIPVQTEQKEFQMQLSLDNQQLAQLKVRINMVGQNIEKIVEQDKDQDLLTKVKQQQQQMDEQSSRRKIGDQSESQAKIACLVTISNATLTDQPFL